MENLILIGVSFVLGILMRRSHRLPEQTGRALGGFIIYVSLPALVLLLIHDLEFDASLVFAALMPWIVFLPALLLYPALIKDRPTAGVLILVTGLGNTSFIGLPMIQTYYGMEAVGIGVVADQLGTFLVLSTVGTFVLLRYSGEEQLRPALVAKAIVTFPPFIALVLAFFLRPLEYPAVFRSVLDSLGSTLTPVALVAVGFQLNPKEFRGLGKPLALGLAYKLVFAPLLIGSLYLLFLPAESSVYQISVFEAAMPSMITAGILVMERNMRPALAALLLGTGTVLSFPSLYLAYTLLQWLAG